VTRIARYTLFGCCLLATRAHASEVSTESLLIWYTFDDAKGGVVPNAASTEGRLSGTITENVSLVDGVDGKAVRLTGRGWSYVHGPTIKYVHKQCQGPMAIAFWFFADDKDKSSADRNMQCS